MFPFLAAVECSLKGMGRAFGLQCERGLSFTRQAVRPAAGRGRANGVNYFIRKAHGRHTEESPQGSATSGMGGSFAWGVGVQPGSDWQVRESATRKAQDAAQSLIHRQG